MNHALLSLTHAAIDKFNWVAAHHLFTTMKWTWRGEDESPTIDELKSQARRLAYEMANEDGSHYSSGRIAVCRTGRIVSVHVGLDAFESIGDKLS